MGQTARMSQFGWVPVLLIVLIPACGSVSVDESDSPTTESVSTVARTPAKPAPTTAQDGDLYLTPGGSEVRIVNGSEDLVSLLDWSYGRFQQARMPEPFVEMVTFDSELSKCESLAGWIRRNGEVSINVCLQADRICKEVNGVVFTSPGKLCLLHELAHAWLFENLSEQSKADFMAHASVEVWNDSEVPWHRRGVEYAADTLAWGLMDRQLRMVRLSEPNYAHLQEGFLLLTGAEPIVTKSFD